MSCQRGDKGRREKLPRKKEDSVKFGISSIVTKADEAHAVLNRGEIVGRAIVTLT